MSVAGRPVEYPIRRSGRRTIGLSIEADGSLLITAPTRATRRDIDEVVLGKARWIARHLGKIAIQPASPTLRYVSGEQVLYRGEWLTLQVGGSSYGYAEVAQLDLFAPPPTGSVAVRGTYLLVPSGPDVRTQLVAWYRREAHRLIIPRVQHFVGLVRRPVARIRITAPERQWGACTSRGTITMSWRLVCAPPALLDYVAAHEAAHLVHRHHRPTFWKLVEQLDPAYREHRKELRERGREFTLPELASED